MRQLAYAFSSFRCFTARTGALYRTDSIFILVSFSIELISLSQNDDIHLHLEKVNGFDDSIEFFFELLHNCDKGECSTRVRYAGQFMPYLEVKSNG